MKTGIRDEAMRSAVDAALSGTVSVYEGEYTTVTSGKKVVHKTIFSPLRAVDGAVKGVLFLAEDVTDRRQVEKQLRAMRNCSVGPSMTRRSASPSSRLTCVSKSSTKGCAISLLSGSGSCRKRFADVTHPDDVAEGVRVFPAHACRRDQFFSARETVPSQGWYAGVSRTSVRLIRDDKSNPLCFCR